jgi:hypothetical protein
MSGRRRQEKAGFKKGGPDIEARRPDRFEIVDFRADPNRDRSNSV